MNGRGLVPVVLVFVLAVSLGAAAQEQGTVKIKVGDEDVVVVRDGGAISLGPGGLVTVSGDWRTLNGSAAAGDLLVELGAIEEDGRLQLALASDVLFDFDSAAIRPDAAIQLAKVAQLIRQRSVGKVEVVGHSDAIGSADYNQGLSEARALGVIRWLNRQDQIPAEIMIARGLGARQPIAHNTMPDGSDNPAGRAQNRRVEIHFATTEAGTRVKVAGTAVEIDDAGVSLGGGAARIDASGVHLGTGGGVTVDSGGGVHIQGVDVGAAVKADSVVSAEARAASDEVPLTCVAGQPCHYVCYHGDCQMTCAGGATCTFACPGGDCQMRCAGGATCAFSCSGGDCLYTCADASECTTSCIGGECVCSGPGC